MSNRVRISSGQLFCTVAMFTESAVLLFLPQPMTKVAGPDAWLVPPVGILLGLFPVAVLISLLIRRHPAASLAEMAKVCLGRWVGGAVCILVAAFALFIASLVVRDIMDFGVIALLPGTPQVAIGLLFAATAWYVALHGSEVLARLATLIFVVNVTSIVFTPIGLFPQMTLTFMQPILGGGLSPVLRAAWPTLAWFGEIMLFGQFLGLLDRPRRALRSLLSGGLVASLILSLLIALTILVFSAPLARKMLFPIYVLVQQVSIGEFLERLEIGLVSIWLTAMILKAGVCLFSASTALATGLGLRRYQWLTLPLAGLALILAARWPSVIAVVSFSGRETPFLFPLELGIPLLILIGSWWRAWRRRPAAA